MATSATQDVLDLLDFAWKRLADRMRTLTDDEWAWRPSAIDADISIRWRVEHLVGTVRDPRNWSWLGAVPPTTSLQTPDSAGSALTVLAAAYADFRAVVGDPAVDLAHEIGPGAGPYATASRLSFVLHIADELIHHGAEAALLRDLYARRLTG